jgi:phosphate transport system permease protein
MDLGTQLAANVGGVSGPARRRRRVFPVDGVARVVLILAACLILAVLVAIFVAMYLDARLSMDTFGWGFLTNSHWNPVEGREDYGALSSIFGTVISTLIAMLLAVPLSILIATFLVELAPRWLSVPMGMGVELLAAVPSIIYGMFGLFILKPILANQIEPWLKESWLGDTPLFQGPPLGLGMLNAGIILAIMILPFITAITRDVLRSVPRLTRESAYGLGATTWEVTRFVTLRYGRAGIVGACLLGLGRAMGETMAVTYVIGNSNQISWSLLKTSNTIASRMANEFMEATSEPLHLSALTELGLLLLVLSVLAQILAQAWIAWAQARTEGRA